MTATALVVVAAVLVVVMVGHGNSQESRFCVGGEQVNRAPEGFTKDCNEHRYHCHLRRCRDPVPYAGRERFTPESGLPCRPAGTGSATALRERL